MQILKLLLIKIYISYGIFFKSAKIVIINEEIIELILIFAAGSFFSVLIFPEIRYSTPYNKLDKYLLKKCINGFNNEFFFVLLSYLIVNHFI